MPAPSPPRRPRSRSAPSGGAMPVAEPGELLVWTDGACKVNPGPGGWAAIVVDHDGAVVAEHHGGAAHTTNNVMEMTAALEGLRAVPGGGRACIVTDSRYLHDGMTSWMAGWKKRGWKTAGNKPVKNRELWEALDAELARHDTVRWHWVRGHVGTELNERADELAVEEAERHAR